MVLAVMASVVAVGQQRVGRVGQQRLDAIVTKLDDEEPGWRLEDIEAERRTRMPPAEFNGALVATAAADRLPRDWDRTWCYDTQWQYCFPEPHIPKPEHIERMKAAAEATEEARALALSLRGLPTGHYPVAFPADRFTPGQPHLMKPMTVSNLLEYDAALAVLVDRDPNRAIRAAHAALNVARSIGDEPTLSAQLSRCNCRSRAARIIAQTLAWGEPTEGLAELQAALLAEADEPVLLNAMRGHRADMHRLFSGLEEGHFTYRDLFTPLGIREPELARPAVFRAYRPFLPGDHAEALRRLTAGVAIAKLPPHEQYAAAFAQRELVTDDFRSSITNQFVWPIDHFVTIVLTSRAELETAAVAIACERFRQKHGRWPLNLAAIPNTILPAVPLSPFDAQPLQYRQLADRLVICCRLTHPTLRWHEPPEFEGDDTTGLTFGVRLWYPKLRAQPPKPEPPPAPE